MCTHNDRKNHKCKCCHARQEVDEEITNWEVTFDKGRGVFGRGRGGEGWGCSETKKSETVQKNIWDQKKKRPKVRCGGGLAVAMTYFGHQLFWPRPVLAMVGHF